MFCQADLSEDIITETGVCYVVTDKGAMLADNIDAELDNATVPAVTGDAAAADSAADASHVDVSSILISADVVMDAKKKSAINRCLVSAL